MFSEIKKRKATLLSVFFTYFVDNLGWAIAFPIFAPLFIDTPNIFFASSVESATRTIVFGVFLAIFPLAQFFSAPLLGEFADRNGRKKAFLISIFLTFCGYCITALGVQLCSLPILFFGRLITGLFAGNLSICLATISDLSEDNHKKLKNFGIVSILSGFSFIFGAFMGGKLADVETSSLFFPAFPFWIAAILSLINLMFILFAFSETFALHKEITFDFLEGVHNIQKALKTKRLKSSFFIYFLFTISWTIIFQFTPVLVIRKFHFDFSDIGDMSAFMGVCWSLGAFFTHMRFMKRFSKKTLEFCLVAFTIFSFFIYQPSTVAGLMLLLALVVFIAGVAWPLCNSIISNLASSESQGKVLGMSQSVQSFAMAISPILGGLTDKIHLTLAFIMAAVFSMFSSIIYFKIKRDL